MLTGLSTLTAPLAISHDVREDVEHGIGGSAGDRLVDRLDRLAAETPMKGLPNNGEA